MVRSKRGTVDAQQHVLLHPTHTAVLSAGTGTATEVNCNGPNAEQNDLDMCVLPTEPSPWIISDALRSQPKRVSLCALSHSHPIALRAIRQVPWEGAGVEEGVRRRLRFVQVP